MILIGKGRNNMELNSLIQPQIAKNKTWAYSSTDKGVKDIFGFEVIFPGLEDISFIVHDWQEEILDSVGFVFEIVEHWLVTEISTGTKVTFQGDDDTAESAVFNACKVLTEAGREKVLSAIATKPKTPKSL